MTYTDTDRLSAATLDRIDDEIEAATEAEIAQLWERYEEAIADWDDDGEDFDPSTCAWKIHQIGIEAIELDATDLIAEIEAAENDLDEIQAKVNARRVASLMATLNEAIAIIAA